MSIFKSIDTFVHKHSNKILSGSMAAGFAGTFGLALSPATASAIAGTLGVSAGAVSIAPMAGGLGIMLGTAVVGTACRLMRDDYSWEDFKRDSDANMMGGPYRWQSVEDNLRDIEIRKAYNRRNALLYGEQTPSEDRIEYRRELPSDRAEGVRDRSTERDFLP